MDAAVILDPLPGDRAVRHARDFTLTRRLAAYLIMLAVYFFYCYNFLVLDYVRPYMIQHFGIDLKATANISLIGNIFVTAGSLIAAPMIARLGRRTSLTGIALWIGAFAAAMAVARTIETMLGVRALLSVGLGAYYVAGINLTVALFPAHQRAKLAAVNSAMFSLAEIVIGLLGAALGDQGWLWMLWLGAVPLLLAPLILLLVPTDRSYVPYGADQAKPIASGGWGEMLSAKWRRYTLSCVFLSGLNFIGYQLFSSFITVYLKQDRGFTAAEMGAIVAMTGVGSLLGGFGWAFIADRFGRRINGAGFILVALAICLFLVAPDHRRLLQGIGFVYGVGLSAAYCWGIWFTEMFPLRLRPYGAALFHGGHVVSMIAPLLVAWSAGRWGLTFAMAWAPIAFGLAAILWFTMPETLRTSPAYKGWDPEAR
jgi:MFS family permease